MAGRGYWRRGLAVYAAVYMVFLYAPVILLCICENRFEHFEFFATSVVGALGYGTDESDNVIQYPLHVAPRGILEPFEWVLATLAKHG